MDTPFYKLLVRRNSKAAKWWRWGDLLYYLGLIVGFISFLSTLFLLRLTSDWWRSKGVWQVSDTWWQVSLMIFGMSALAFVIGCLFVRKSYAMAKNEGINSDNPSEERDYIP